MKLNLHFTMIMVSTMTSRAKGCHHETLAEGPIAKVQRCTACGVFALHVGPTTLRLDPGAAESLWITLGEAIANGLHDAPPRPTVLAAATTQRRGEA